jgi:hypothetical protein
MATAMMPLRTLENPKNAYGNIMYEKVAGILKRGEGLPLLFPQYELGFTYHPKTKFDTGSSRGTNGREASWQDVEKLHDTAPYTSQIRVGHRLPHAEMQLQFSFEMQNSLGLQSVQSISSATDRRVISLTDINAQLRKFGDPPFFVTLGPSSFATELKTLTDRLSNSCDVAIKFVPIDEQCGNDSVPQDPLLLTAAEGVLVDVYGEWRQLLSTTLTVRSQQESAVILVRPDGHVGAIQVVDLGNKNLSQYCSFIEEHFYNSIENLCFGYNICQKVKV